MCYPIFIIITLYFPGCPPNMQSTPLATALSSTACDLRLCLYTATAVHHVSSVIGQLTRSSVIDAIIVVMLTSSLTAEHALVIAVFVYTTGCLKIAGCLILLCCSIFKHKQAYA